jgi:hypothetical protein
MKPEINFFARGKSRVGHIINQLARWSLPALVKPLTAKVGIQNQRATMRPARKSTHRYHPKPICRWTTTTRPNAHTDNE